MVINQLIPLYIILFSGYFSLVDTDPFFEVLTLLCQKLLFSKFLFMAPIKLFASLHIPE